MKEIDYKIVSKAAKISATFIGIFGLLFYFGYGSPLPFSNAEYAFFDNLWLTIFPIMFVGLFLGLQYEKIGGYIVSVSISLGFIISLIIGQIPGLHMIVPLVIGLMYLFVGYKKKRYE
ncbi:MAG: hypothetical protein WC280_01245 [Patescibacteria group bacterium]